MRIPIFELSKRQWMLLVFLLALATRAGLALVSYSPERVYAGEAERIARSLALHGAFADPYVIPTGPTAHCGPFYPAVLAFLYWIFGMGPAATFARIGLLILVNSIACALLPAVGVALRLPLWCGVGAGLFAAAIPMHRTVEIFNAWDEPYAELLLMAVLVLLIGWRELREGHAKALLLYGALWGLLLQLNATLLLTMLGLAAADLLFRRAGRASEIRRWAVVFVMAVVVMVPWAIRNRVRLGGWVLGRSILGLELSVSNRDGVGPLGDDKGTHPSYNVAEAEKVRQIGEIAYNRGRLAETVHWIETHRGRFAALTLERFAIFWLGWWENPGVAWAFALATVLAAVGVRYLWKDGRREVLGIFAVVWICYPTIYYLCEYVPRYRLPMWWTVLLAAAYGGGRLWIALNLSRKFSGI